LAAQEREVVGLSAATPLGNAGLADFHHRTVALLTARGGARAARQKRGFSVRRE